MTQLLTVTEAASHLRQKRSWVYANWRRLGIPFIKVGNSLRVRASDLEKWLDSQKAM